MVEKIKNIEAETPESDVEAHEEIEIEELLRHAVAGEEHRLRVKRLANVATKKLGTAALESPDSYEEGNALEEIIHYMRWNQAYLFDCPLIKLHEYEMCLAAHIVFVKGKENHWGVMCDMSKVEFKRMLKLYSTRCSGKTVGEREAEAVATYPKLREREMRHNAFQVFRAKCDGMASVLEQLDNSLKKTLQMRQHEVQYGSLAPKHTNDNK